MRVRVKLRKCSFFQREIEFLGHLIRKGTIKPSPLKVEALYRYEEPKTLKQLLSFLGLASYYRKFIEHFTELAHELYECATANRNNKRRLKDFNNKCKEAFDNLRKYLVDESKVLLLPDLNKTFKLYCDACDYGIGSALTQQDDKGDWRPCTYYSKHLSKTERRYSTSEKELLACVKSIEFNKQYLLGREFILVTDHKPLTWLMTHKNPSSRLARWIVRMEQYTLRIEYRKGSQHGNADALSRWPLPDEDEDGADDFNDIVINCVHVERKDAAFRIIHKISQDPIENKKYIELKVQVINLKHINVVSEQQRDNNIRWITDKLRKFKIRPADKRIPIANKEQATYRKEWNNLFIDHKTLWRRAEDKIGNQVTQYVVPQHQRQAVIEKMHNNILAGHLMLDKTIARVRSRYFWPFQTTEVDRFIASCEPCQLANHPHTTPKARLKPIQIQVSRTLELVTSDYLGPLKSSRNGNTNIIVICDQKSKYAWFQQRQSTSRSKWSLVSLRNF